MTGARISRPYTDRASLSVTEAIEHRACRHNAPGERAPVVLLGGPLDGRRAPGNGPFPPSPYRCARPAGGQWHHYVHKGQGVYEHAGLCDDHHTPEDHPGLPCEPS